MLLPVAIVPTVVGKAAGGIGLAFSQILTENITKLGKLQKEEKALLGINGKMTGAA